MTEMEATGDDSKLCLAISRGRDTTCINCVGVCVYVCVRVFLPGSRSSS